MSERENFETVWSKMPVGEKNVFVSSYLKTLSKWDLKRILCDVLGVDSYMDDEALKKALGSVVWSR